jgi:hypothetical protein
MKKSKSRVEGAERRDETIELGFRVRDAHRAPFAARQLEQHLVGQLRSVDRYPHDEGSLLWSELWHTHSREALVRP